MTEIRVTLSPDADEAFEGRIDAALEPPAADLVTAYFHPDKPFAADTFDVLGLNDPMRVTVNDLLAVTLLNVVVPPVAVRAVLGPEASIVAELLAKVPAEVPLWAATDADLGAATAIWKLFDKHLGVGRVTAGKLLARKRPLLIPMFDSVIENALQAPPDRFWTTLRAALHDVERRGAIEALRPPGLTRRVSTLRLLDVAVWMRYSEGTNARTVRQELGLALERRPAREDRS